MGTTATSLHILRSSGNTASLSGEIEKVYRRLGYARPKKPAGISAKQVILVGRDDDDFLSIYDSDNDQIDTGELKDLAVQLSKRLASVAILTSIYDGDTFEFVLFHKGKQVDAAVSDPGSHQGGLKFLAGKRRAQAWLDMFYIRDLIRARGAGAPGRSVNATPWSGGRTNLKKWRHPRALPRMNSRNGARSSDSIRIARSRITAISPEERPRTGRSC